MPRARALQAGDLAFHADVGEPALQGEARGSQKLDHPVDARRRGVRRRHGAAGPAAGQAGAAAGVEAADGGTGAAVGRPAGRSAGANRDSNESCGLGVSLGSFGAGFRFIARARAAARS